MSSMISTAATQSLYFSEQGCGVRVETGVGVRLSRPFCLAWESELESGKFCRLRFRLGVTGYHRSADDVLGRTVMHRPGADDVLGHLEIRKQSTRKLEW